MIEATSVDVRAVAGPARILTRVPAIGRVRGGARIPVGEPRPEVKVEPLDPLDALAAGRVLAAGLGSSPVFSDLCPDPHVRGRVLRPLLTATVRDTARHGVALLARVDGRSAGVALWMPPGGTRRRARRAGALVRAAAGAPARFRALARAAAALERGSADPEAWQLQAFGVHPGVQGLGVGAALIEAGLAAVDESGQPSHVHLSDPATVEFFRRWGFEPGPGHLGMTRPATVPARPRAVVAPEVMTA